MLTLFSKERDKFTVLYETYGKIIYFTIKRFQFDEYTIEDLSQEIYMILVRHLDDIDLDDPVRTRNYIITVTRNYCINYMQRKYSKIEEPINDLEFSSNCLNESDIILQKIIQKEQINKLAEEIKKLNYKYKSVIELKYVNGFSNQEIADILNIKKKTVDMRLYRAKKILLKKMEE